MQNDKLVAQQSHTEGLSTFNFFDPIQFDTMQRLSKMFANSELVPDMYKISENNPIEKATANCMIAIEIATRIGASPLMIMQNMVPIYGRPSWSSKFLIATVNTCGRFNALKFKITSKGKLGKVEYTEYKKEWQQSSNGKGYYKNTPVQSTIDLSEMDDLECIAYTTEKGSDVMLESSPVSISLAIKEGWYTKNGSKWQTMTKQMLMYRAASMWTNIYAPELSMGMRTVEENEDIAEIIDVDGVDITNEVSREIDQNANKTTLSIKKEGETQETTNPIPTATEHLKEMSQGAKESAATVEELNQASQQAANPAQPQVVKQEQPSIFNK